MRVGAPSDQGHPDHSRTSRSRPECRDHFEGNGCVDRCAPFGCVALRRALRLPELRPGLRLAGGRWQTVISIQDLFGGSLAGRSFGPSHLAWSDCDSFTRAHGRAHGLLLCSLAVALQRGPFCELRRKRAFTSCHIQRQTRADPCKCLACCFPRSYRRAPEPR